MVAVHEGVRWEREREREVLFKSDGATNIIMTKVTKVHFLQNT